MGIKHVTVFGSGVLGAQIAFQCAFHGFQVAVYDIGGELLTKAQEKFQLLGQRFQQDLNATPHDVEAALQRLSCTTDLAASVREADLAIESIPENVQVKKEFYARLGPLAPARTIFCTNSSTLLPSQFAQGTGRPERFLALHFANNIWTQNTAEVMGHSGTDPVVFDAVVAFAEAIGMVALPVRKEQPGYILNTLLAPFLLHAMELYAKGVADPETIDKTWVIATKSPRGPFAMLDIVGLTTPYNISLMKAEATGSEDARRVAQMLKEQYIEQGKLGVSTGEGFYKYPNPRYQQPDFLR